MTKRNTFRKISSINLGWHSWLGEGENAKTYADWLFCEGELGGYQFGIMFYSARPDEVGDEDARHPGIELTCLTPDRERLCFVENFARETFKPAPFGVAIGNNVLDGKLGSDGMPQGYDVKVSIGDIIIDLTARAVATGLQFSDEEHGYSYYNPVKNAALGWWPLVPRAEAEGAITFKGKQVKGKGTTYLERQLTNIPNSFGSGGQVWWSWGHFTAGDYTAVWTDSAASEHYQYRHFSPFALWKGSDLILSTFQFNIYVERFGIDPVSGYLKPEVVGLRAVDGNVELRAQILPGEVGQSMQLGEVGQYTRQYCPVNMQLRRWDDEDEASGIAAHEFGMGDNWFPFERLK